MIVEDVPGRGIVMQTALIKGNPKSTEKLLEAWEKGSKGSMVSSFPPTDEEKQAWGLPT